MENYHVGKWFILNLGYQSVTLSYQYFELKGVGKTVISRTQYWVNSKMNIFAVLSIKT